MVYIETARKNLPSDVYYSDVSPDGTIHNGCDSFINSAGCWPMAVIELLKPQKPVGEEVVQQTQEKPQETAPARPKINPGEFVARLKQRIKFKEEGRGLRVIIGKIFRAGKDKYKTEEAKGHNESAAYGIGEAGDKEFVFYSMHWDYWAGTLGVVAGEKFVQAAKLALKKNLPLVSVYSSAGARQEEGVAALNQMSRISFFAEKLKEKNLPNIAILASQVWGGISASAVPAADVTVVLDGTDVGFAGPRVIKEYTGYEVPKGAQSGEAQVERRNLDLLIKAEDTYDWISKLLNLSQNEQTSKDDILSLLESYSSEGKPPVIFNDYKQVKEAGVHAKLLEQDLYEVYQQLMKDPNRLDTVKILRYAFTDLIPLFNFQETKDFLKYPGIIAALGKLGKQTLLIIGNQPTYQKRSDGSILKIPSSPTPADLDYLMRMLELGKRLKIPVVFLCDTTGAKPTLESEYADIARKIESAIRAENKYPYPIISIVTGILGSGGGLATAPMVDNIAGLSGTLICVAEPASAAAIYRKKTDSDEVRATIRELEMTVYDQLRDKIFDAVIKVSEDATESDNMNAIQAIQYHITDSIYRLNNLSPRKLKKRRDSRMERLRGRPLKGTK